MSLPSFADPAAATAMLHWQLLDAYNLQSLLNEWL
jgi:hypothetical protein